MSSCVLIPLTRGFVAQIDAEDKHLVEGFKWHILRGGGGNLYAKRSHKGRGLLTMHRAILSPPEGFYVDHIDGDGLNNRRSNLRIADRSQNQWNKRLSARNTSGYKGVCRVRGREPWMAQIAFRNKHFTIGRFKSAEEAARAYDQKAAELFGEFAHLNFPEAR